MEIKIVKTDCPKEKPDSSTLGFGKIFTDHMFIMDYSREEGWHDARIVPFGYISLQCRSAIFLCIRRQPCCITAPRFSRA